MRAQDINSLFYFITTVNVNLKYSDVYLNTNTRRYLKIYNIAFLIF